MDDGDGDAELFDFGAKCFGEAFYGEFGGGVEALIGEAHDATDGGEVDDAAGLLSSHVREDGLAGVDGTHEVGLHLELDFVL